jgi:hypothetical protein
MVKPLAARTAAARRTPRQPFCLGLGSRYYRGPQAASCLTAAGQFQWPPAGSKLAVSGQSLVAVSGHGTAPQHRAANHLARIPALNRVAGEEAGLPGMAVIQQLSYSPLSYLKETRTLVR